MFITNYLQQNKKPIISFEFFPPRTEKGIISQEKAITALKEIEPDFVSVTFGAGGSSRKGSFQLIDKLKNKYNFNVIAYLAAYGLSVKDIKSILDKFKQLGVKNILAVRGDEPKEINNFTFHSESFKYASELISLIKPLYNFNIGVAGYPEGHKEQNNFDNNIKHLKQKVNFGADFIISQFFADNSFYYDFVNKCRDSEINVPIIPGIMPIYSMNMFENLSEMCGTTITEELRNSLNKLPKDDKDAFFEFALEFTTTQCKDLLKKGVPGLHFYTMNRAKLIIETIKQLKKDNLL
ncbi:MAG: methylenetetrahydrofolate reductase [Bacteroidales bacterium]|nr:methylenetetrahydrofolate reductase [Bacteroidales bacterium]